MMQSRHSSQKTRHLETWGGSFKIVQECPYILFYACLLYLVLIQAKNQIIEQLHAIQFSTSVPCSSLPINLDSSTMPLSKSLPQPQFRFFLLGHSSEHWDGCLVSNPNQTIQWQIRTMPKHQTSLDATTSSDLEAQFPNSS